MDKNKKNGLDSIDADEAHVYYAINLANLKKALEKLDRKIEQDNDIYQMGLDVIQSLDGFKKFDDGMKEKDQISLRDAALLLSRMTNITNHYLDIKAIPMSDANKIKKHTTMLQEECRILAKETDRIFKPIKRKDTIKKIAAGIGLFLAAILLAASICALFAATHGGIFGMAIPMFFLKTTVGGAWFSASAGLTPALTGAVATGGVFATLAGMGFFGSAAMLRSGVKKRPYHQLGQFAKTAEQSLGLHEPNHKKHKRV